MGGKIEAYVDCTSPYSYLAFLYLRRNRELLASHDIEVEFHPIFLGGVNVASGNKPPWTLPAKAAYGKFDGKRAAKYFGVEPPQAPSFFPPLTVMPQRAATYIKQSYPRERFEGTALLFWTYMFYRHIDISKPENLIQLLSEDGYSREEVEQIMAAAKSPEIKKALADRTQEAVDRGAFGAPWYWVRNSKGEEEPFFGSDRFHYMWQYLGIPFNDIQIVEKSKL